MNMTIRGALLALLLAGGAAQAQEDAFDVGALVDRVVAAYGGDALTGLRNYEIAEAYIGPNLGQSWAPELTGLNQNNLRWFTISRTAGPILRATSRRGAGYSPTWSSSMVKTPGR